MIFHGFLVLQTAVHVKSCDPKGQIDREHPRNSALVYQNVMQQRIMQGDYGRVACTVTDPHKSAGTTVDKSRPAWETGFLAAVPQSNKAGAWRVGLLLQWITGLILLLYHCGGHSFTPGVKLVTQH